MVKNAVAEGENSEITKKVFYKFIKNSYSLFVDFYLARNDYTDQ
jgi:hypothetical protein